MRCGSSVSLCPDEAYDALWLGHVQPLDRLAVDAFAVVLGLYNSASERDGMGAGHRNLRETVPRSGQRNDRFD